ncbi:probable cytochrome P450 6a14 [Diachasma alloeum]|uniref:probable cytochrome P450 6a14 n=1 Tax=Diachasma alloeum TaxID=454923 RepID=UPI0007384933|nr:probable cytochrome P450 6a14 [Diachasma alloeum]
MEFSFIECIITISVLSCGIYYYFVKNFNFWKSRGVAGPEPCFFFGNMKDLMRGNESWALFLRRTYQQYIDEPMVGIYAHREPILILNDLELIKTVLIKDFSNFVDRGAKADPHDVLSNHLFMLDPKRWRPLRMKLSPVFTSGKLRDMFYLINQCGNRLENYLDKVDGQSIDMRDIAGKFATDVIGLCAFGVEANALEEEDSAFRKMGLRMLQVMTSLKAVLKMYLMEMLPPVYRLIGGLLAEREMQSFFINLTRDTMEHRRKMNITRHDFIDLLRSLKEEPSQIDDIELTDGLLAAQLFVFFFAGFETSSSTISNCLFELAMNHEIQDKLREEIKQELGESREITYEGIKRMKYLDLVVKETLRKYPPLTMLMRKSAKDYTFPGTNITIPAKTGILIPIYAIQRDSRYYPDPDVFNPENFREEAVQSRHPMTYLSFGDGPRNCIGARFGSIQTKVGIAKLLQNFVVDICDKTDKDYTLNNRAFMLTPKNGIFVKVTKLRS